MKQEHLRIVQEYIEDNPDESNFSLAQIMEDDGVIDKSHRTLRLYVAQAKGLLKEIVGTPSLQDQKDVQLVAKKPAELDNKIEKEDDDGSTKSSIILDGIYRYNLDYGKESIIVSDDVVNKLFCAYSRKGLNYNKPQIISTLNIDRKIFDALVSRQGLSKESEPLGPYFIANNSAQKQSDEIALIISDLLEAFSESDSGIAETVVREYKKKMADFKSDVHREEELYNSLIAHLPDITINKYTETYRRPLGKNTLYVVIGDMHIGLETDSFNVGSARIALSQMAAKINQKLKSGFYKDVVLLFLGDVMHTVSGINHANMWKDIEPGLWGAGAIIKPYELIAELVSNIDRVSAIYGVGGNHDRLADRKDLEPSDEGGKLVFFMLENTFKDVKVVWDPDRVQFTEDHITFILLHGDQGQDKRSGQEIAWNLGDPTTYNLILVGHTHSRQINKNDDGIGFRKMVCPAFCPTDSYAERLGYNSLPGYVLITPDEEGFPIVSDHPLHYHKTR